MEMEWKPFLVEYLLLLDKKGWDPVGIIPVNFPGKAHKFIKQVFAGNGNNFAGFHMAASQMMFISCPTFLKVSRAIFICGRVWVAIRLILIRE